MGSPRDTKLKLEEDEATNGSVVVKSNLSQVKVNEFKVDDLHTEPTREEYLLLRQKGVENTRQWQLLLTQIKEIESLPTLRRQLQDISNTRPGVGKITSFSIGSTLLAAVATALFFIPGVNLIAAIITAAVIFTFFTASLIKILTTNRQITNEENKVKAQIDQKYQTLLPDENPNYEQNNLTIVEQKKVTHLKHQVETVDEQQQALWEMIKPCLGVPFSPKKENQTELKSETNENKQTQAQELNKQNSFSNR